MTGPLHTEAAAGRWWRLSICEQMGSVGSEVSRALRWKLRNHSIARGAIERALELLDLTLADPRHRGSVARLRELARAREVTVDFLLGSNEYRSTAESLSRYFDAFAMAAALERERSARR
ncbi:hypothetical protein GX411_05355 [Candidatus Fermentibacteria bacterium]|nr:hypothetical protein [Candidatus Fermentibacteria bacterium]